MLLRRWLAIVCAVILGGVLVVVPVAAQSTTLADQLHLLAQRAQEGMEAAEHQDVAAIQAEYGEIHEAWESSEDGVREQDPTGYVELEAALDGVKDAVRANPPDVTAAHQAFDRLMDEANEVAGRLAGGTASASPAVASTPAEVLGNLDAAAAALARGDNQTAAAELQRAIQAWPSIEGAIAAKSPDAYTAIEGDLGRAAAALKAEPADQATAATALQDLRSALAPFAGEQSYTAFDAAAIILREGLEALLVVVALLAFLQRSGNSDKRGWIWGGAAGGILVSIGTAFVLQALFSRVSAGQNREIIEGATGLIAAALLFYVSYWLHSKSSLRAWQKYINTRTSQVLAGGSMLGLSLLAFLAVFREGAETTVFYLGMAPSIAARDLILGLGLGGVVLAVVAVLMLVAGVRLPLRPFFRIAGLLVYYLGFKFVGTGIHALQVAGVLPVSPVAFVREIPIFGVYPTWETLLPQVLLLAAAATVFLYLRTLDRRTQLDTPTSAA